MRILRFDSLPLTGKALRLDNGWLRAPATLTRTGVFEYRLAGGKFRRELRLPEEVFHPDSLASFSLVPLTNDHPWSEPDGLNGENAHAFAVGAVGNPRADEARGVIEADLLVTHADAVKSIDAGRQEVSCGYFSDLEMTPGVWVDPQGNRHAYDGIQRNIRGNHVALVDKGRAGPVARVRLDSAEGGVLVSDSSQTNALRVDISPGKGVAKMETVKITVDGIEVEVPKLAGALFAKERANAADMLAAVKADSAKVTAEAKVATDKQTARADAAEATLKATETKLTEATGAKFDAAVSERVTLLTQARGVLGADAKFDGLDTPAIHKLVISKVDPEAKLDGKSPDYIAARFDAALIAKPGNSATAEAAAKIAAGKSGTTNDGKSAEEIYKAAVFGAWAAPAK